MGKTTYMSVIYLKDGNILRRVMTLNGLKADHLEMFFNPRNKETVLRKDIASSDIKRTVAVTENEQ